MQASTKPAFVGSYDGRLLFQATKVAFVALTSRRGFNRLRLLHGYFFGAICWHCSSFDGTIKHERNHPCFDGGIEKQWPGVDIFSLKS